MAKAMEGDDVSSIISIDYIRLPILLTIGIVLYDEAFNLSYLIGGILILVGNWINSYQKNKVATRSCMFHPFTILTPKAATIWPPVCPNA